jgi:hypothetical protein
MFSSLFPVNQGAVELPSEAPCVMTVADGACVERSTFSHVGAERNDDRNAGSGSPRPGGSEVDVEESEEIGLFRIRRAKSQEMRENGQEALILILNRVFSPR